MSACLVPGASGQSTAPADGKKFYEAVRSFNLGNQSLAIQNLKLQRDRGQITFLSGTMYFAAPVEGKVFGAVFIGSGTFHAEAPPNRAEQVNLIRYVHEKDVDSTFQTAVLRFSDDTFDVIGKAAGPSAMSRQSAPDSARKLAQEFSQRFIKETAVNIPARVAISVLNQEQPGIFFAQFDKGHLGRFSFLFDPQARVPTEIFGINGGEKGFILGASQYTGQAAIWTAFYSQDDYVSGRAQYSDTFDQVKLLSHDMDLDLSDPDKWLRYTDTIVLEAEQGGLRAVELSLNEALTDALDERLNKSERLQLVKDSAGKTLDAVQEDWDGSVAVFLPAPLSKGDRFTLVFRLEGQHMTSALGVSFPVSDTWYLRHGYLQRSTFRAVFHHSKARSPVSLGTRVRDAVPDPGSSGLITEWRMATPVPFFAFGMGAYERYTTTADIGSKSIPVEFDSIPFDQGVKPDFVGAEMANSLRYYSALYGPYPYDSLRGIYQFRPFGEGFATFLLLAPASSNMPQTFAFISHEVGHQWWGDEVCWRSYRDQWLSEGFAEYSAILYTGQRKGDGERRSLLEGRLTALRDDAQRHADPASGHAHEVGPIILGERLGDTAAVYCKGAYVLRMLHFLFTDPQTLDDRPFFQMMADFVNAYRDGSASTEDFIAMANRHFPDTAIGRKYGLKDLNWFFEQWVYSAALPNYRLDYKLEDTGGVSYLKGTLYQGGVPAGERWQMPLPLVLTYGKDKVARGVVVALGSETPVSIKLPAKPNKVELDPDLFVLSLKTTAEKAK